MSTKAWKRNARLRAAEKRKRRRFERGTKMTPEELAYWRTQFENAHLGKGDA